MGNFLDDLKKSVETGEFNSEAAKKIIEIANLADEKASGKSVEEMQKMVDKRLEVTGTKTAKEGDIIELNSEYEKKMADIKKQDAINLQLATLIEIEDMVKASVVDMFGFVQELEEKFSKFIDEKDPMIGELSLKIEEIKNVFQPTLMEYKHKE